MAAGQAEIRGCRSFLEQLATPRPITRIGLAVAGFACAHLAWIFLPPQLIAYLSGVAASFCLLCAGAIWSMRDKADMVLEGDHLRAIEFKNARNSARLLRRRSTWRAALIAGCALAAASPAVAHQLAGAMWHWMTLVGGVGVGEAAYGFLLANAWEDELRNHRDGLLQRAKESDERKALIERLKESLPVHSSALQAGWTEPVGVLKPPSQHH